MTRGKNKIKNRVIKRGINYPNKEESPCLGLFFLEKVVYEQIV